MIRILHIVSAMNCGGTENMIMSLLRNIDREKIQFDFLVNTTKKSFFDDEIEKLGGRIYYIPRWNGKNTFSYIKKLKSFLKEHPEHNIIHGHIASSSAIYTEIAKKLKRYVISHSHNKKGGGKSLKDMLFKLTTYAQRYRSDYLFACSKDAGIVRFGKNVINKPNFLVLKNAIDINKYTPDTKLCELTKNKYNIDNKLVIGHIGRFTEAKNHSFLLEVFSEITKMNEDSVLILAGEGECEEQIKTKAKSLNILDKIIFTGVLNDINSIINIMDCFVFPSLHEGLGIAVIEAQTHGIPCFINKELPQDLYINKNVYGLSLDKTAKDWAQFIIEHAHDKEDYKKSTENINKAGYNILETAKKLENFYINVTEEMKK